MMTMSLLFLVTAKSKNDRFLGWEIWIGLILLYMLGRFLWDLMNRETTRDWVVTTATVTHVTTEEGTSYKGGPASTVLRVHYSYMGTTEHEGVYPIDKNFKSDATKLATSLPGSTFEARYNPRNEASSIVLLADRAG